MMHKYSGRIAALPVLLAAALLFPASARAQANKTDKVTPEFVVRQAGITNMAEMEIGMLAETKATNQQVRAFAQRMVRDHTALDASLKAAAQLAGIQMPKQLDDEHASLLQQLKQKSGSDFDTTYMDKMVAGHEKAVGLLQDASGNLSDGPIAKCVQHALPIIQDHLQQARSVRNQLAAK